mgnify:CR=1 FL=1
MPAYLELLPFIVEEYGTEMFAIPFVDLLYNLALIVGCLIIGFGCSYWKPQLSAKIAKFITPVTYLILAGLAEVKIYY